MEKTLTPPEINTKLINDFENKTKNLVNFFSQKINNFNNYEVVIIGITKKTNFESIDQIRQQLYKLYLPKELKIIDIGNFSLSPNNEQTFSKLRSILEKLNDKNIKIIVIGEKISINIYFFEHFKRNKLNFSNLVIDPQLNYTHNKIKKLNTKNYLNYFNTNKQLIEKIIHLGHQNYLVNQQSVEDFIQKGNIIYRLSEVKADFYNLEPEFRNSEIISINLSAVKFSDAPGTSNPQPNGFTLLETCKLANFAGLSDKIKIFGAYDYNITTDINYTGAKAQAIIIWHFLDALNRKKKIENKKNDDYLTYFVKHKYKNNIIQMKFLYCKKTNRWWVILENEKYEKILPCSQTDYETIKKNQLSIRIENYLKLYTIK